METVQEHEASEELLQQITEVMLKNNGTLGDIRGFSADEFEAIYSLAYNLHAQGKYQDAEKIFQFLCIYSHMDKRFWMGLGACRQQLKKYETAIDAYSYIALLDVENPYPPLHAADCYLALGDLEKAESGLQAALHWAGEDEQYQSLRVRAQLLLKAVQEKKENSDAND